MATLDRHHHAQPKKPAIITEFGALAGGDDAAWDRQVIASEDTMQMISARPYVAGCAWWTLADYETPEGVRETGLFSRDRQVARLVQKDLRDQFTAFLGKAGSE